MYARYGVTGAVRAPADERRADDGLRTRDLQLGKLALYQLSYVRVRRYFSMPAVGFFPG